MSRSPDHDNGPPGSEQALSQSDAGFFTEVPVYVGVLHATAGCLELLRDFFTDTDPAIRTRLGRFVIARQYDDIGDPGLEATILVHELAEAADLLRTLAGYIGDEP
jgi:hypothetical protein